MIKKILTKVLIFILILFSKTPSFFLNLLKYFIYILLYRIINYRLDVVRVNLFSAFPDKSSFELEYIEQNFYKNLSNIIIQNIQSISFSKDELKSKIWLHHQAKLDLMNAEKLNKNIFVVTAHYGNWEYAVLLTSLETKLQTYGIYKQLNNETFDKFIKQNRGRFGLKLIDTNDIKENISNYNSTNSVFCFIADQTPVNIDKSYKTKFLKVPETPFYKGFAELAKASNAVVFYASIQNIDAQHYEIKFERITDDASQSTVDEILSKYVEYLERDIIAKPEYWLWTHKRWKRAGLQYKN